MPLTDDELRQLERLARIDVPEAERSALLEELNQLLDLVGTLEEAGPGPAPDAGRPGPANVFREDRVRPSLPQGAALAGAPATEDGFFRVPRTVEGD